MGKQMAVMLLTLLVLLSAAIKLPAQNAAPSTAEDRARLVKLTRALEASPLDESLTGEREWAIKWLIQVPDIHVSMCPSIIGDFHKYKYSSQITVQLMLAEAAYGIENPDKASDQSAQYVAGAQSALKVYSALLQVNPKEKSKVLDEVQQQQSEGKLPEVVRANAQKSCTQK